MFIAHLPAGYLLAKPLLRRYQPRYATALLIVALVASVLPDADLFYFYWIDQQQHHHHSYWTHWPVFWLVIVAVGLSLGALLRQTWLWQATLMLGLGTGLHMLLDTVAGGIMWLAPWSTESIVLTTVTDRYDGWLWNFVWHWTAILELMIVILALYRATTYKAFTDCRRGADILYDRTR